MQEEELNKRMIEWECDLCGFVVVRVVTSRRLQQARNLTVFARKPLIRGSIQWTAIRSMFTVQSDLFRIGKYLISGS